MTLRALPLLACLAACGPAARDAGPEVFSCTGRTMGTSWQVQVGLEGVDEATRGAIVQSLASDVERELRDVNREMSTYIDDSQISRFAVSRATGAWFAVAKPFVELVAEALRIGRASGGAFDITIAPLVELWGFGKSERREKPSDAAVEAARARCGTQHLELRQSPPALRKLRPELAIDLSAIAKGHGVDRVGTLLDARGLRRWWVEIGGEVRTRGEKGKGAPWRVAIERPRQVGREAHLVLALVDGALATSGDYRNFFVENGERYSHILDPRSGRPISRDVAQISVWAPSCATADAWATALMVLGADNAMKTALAQNLPVLMLVRRKDGLSELRSPAFEERFSAPSRSRSASRK